MIANETPGILTGGRYEPPIYGAKSPFARSQLNTTRIRVTRLLHYVSTRQNSSAFPVLSQDGSVRGTTPPPFARLRLAS